MNRMIRSLRSLLCAAVIICAVASVLPADTVLAANHWKSSGAEQYPRRHDDLTFTQIVFPEASATAVSDINDRGQIVGAYIDTGGAQHGFLLDNGVFYPN